MKLSIIDLFAGAGGLSHGFLQTGKFEIKVAVEINKDAQNTYLRNHGSNYRMISDIKTINYNEISQESIDIVIGGPPCQGFSNANRQKNELISGNNQLVKDYIKAVEELNPKAFVMENVKTMNSKTHKFFFCENDTKELKDLEKYGVKLQEEKFVVGTDIELVEELVEFINEDIEYKPFVITKEIDQYILDDKVYDFLKMINKRSEIEKKFKIIAENNKNFRIDENSWISKHKKYFCESYKTLFLRVNKLLIESFETNSINKQLMQSVKIIVEIQKLLLKLNELKKHKVLVNDVFVRDGDVYFSINTFNVFKYVLAKFRKLGYSVDHFILNAAEYGVPQYRERLIVIGIKEEFLKQESITMPPKLFTKEEDFYQISDVIKDLEEYEPSTKVTCEGISKRNYEKVKKHALYNYFNDNNGLYNHIMTQTTDVAKKRFKQLKQGENFHNLDESLKHTYSNPGRTQSSIYKRLAYDSVSGTVTNVRKAMWIHPTKDRAVSIREAARLQSFPDSFIFEGNKNSQYQQVGNAVPPLLARAVAEHLLYLMGYKPEKSFYEIMKSNNI